MQPLIPYFEPFSIDIGPVAIHGFGILVAIGFLVGGNVAMKKAVRFTGDPAAAERVNRLVGWLVLGTFIGGHLGDVLLYRSHLIADDPMILLRVWEGLSSYGGFAACVPLAIWFVKRENLPVWPYLDALAIAFSIGWFFGRMGCFSAHDHPGTQTNFWLGVYGMTGNPTVATHDLGLYEALWSGAVFLLFTVLDRKPRFHGFYVGLIALLYGPFRFVLDFWRSSDIDANARVAGLTPAQYGSVVVTMLGVWMLARRSKTEARASFAS